MTTKRIIYTRPDGGIDVVVPSARFMREFDGTEDEAITVILAKDVPKDAVGVEVVEVATIPATRRFRNTWVKSGGGGAVDVDMPKARVQRTGEIRIERDVRLAQEDISYIRADEIGDTTEKQRIATLKQELRDFLATIQSDLNAITTPETLGSYKPTWPT